MQITLFWIFFKVEYADCVDKLEKELVTKYRQQFEELYKTEAPTWETHGNLMVCCYWALENCVSLLIELQVKLFIYLLT